MTAMDEQILHEINRRGGVVISLFRLAHDLNIDYHHSWDSISKLESSGHVSVTRQRGRPMTIYAKERYRSSEFTTNHEPRTK